MPRISASYAFFEALWEAGVTYCFVNLGSDHPSIIEAFVKGRKEKPNAFPEIITCPNEMVALAMADGYARLTGKIQCVIVHVDVGTQGLGAAIHDSCMGRAPVLIFAGLSPFTIEGEMRGSRTEYIHWIQDVPDQKQIVAQYCRYTGEIKTGKNVKQMVNRAISFAMSDPKGPVYLMGAREVMEEEIEPYQLNQQYWRPIEPAALPASAVKDIAESLFNAQEPLIITGYSGRNHHVPGELVKLANRIPRLQVLDTGGSDMCFPANHPAWLGLKYGNDPSIASSDVILVLDCDVPWIPTQCSPKESAKIFHIDADPLKHMMPTAYINAIARFRTDSFTSMNQLNEYIDQSRHTQGSLSTERHRESAEARRIAYQKRLSNIESMAVPESDGSYGAHFLISELRKSCPADTIWVIEAVTLTYAVADQIQASIPGSYINCGGGGLGWSGGASLGVKLASMSDDWQKRSDPSRANGAPANGAEAKPRFVCCIAGDGTYMFSVPSSVHWIAQKYSLPVLSIVLNNKGWRAPKRSLLLVHPENDATDAELKIDFSPTPDYAGIAKASAGGRLWAERTAKAEEVSPLLKDAVEAVKGGQGAVFEAQLDGPTGKYSK